MMYYSKAIAGGIGGALVVFLVYFFEQWFGTEVPSDVQDSAQVIADWITRLIIGVVTVSGIVYISPKNKEKK